MVNEIKKEPIKQINIRIPFILYLDWLTTNDIQEGDITARIKQFIESDTKKRTPDRKEEVIKALETVKKDKTNLEIELKTIEANEKLKEEEEKYERFDLMKRRLSEGWDFNEKKDYG